jgi:hypothetical protein
MSEIMGLCSKCKNYPNCKQICRPVEELLNKLSSKPFIEKWAKGDNGAPIIYSYPTSRKEYRFSDLKDFDIEEVSSPEPEPEPIPEEEKVYEPANLVSSRVFYKRFFERKEYKEIAKEENSTPEKVRGSYFVAKKSLDRIVKVMDRKEKAGKMMARCSFGNDEKWFIANKIIGLPIGEIADIVGLGEDWVGRRVRGFEKTYRSGGMSVVNG